MLPRAYTNLSAKSVVLKNYVLANHWLTAGIQYADERDLYSWKEYMLSFMARLKLETGDWTEAYRIAMVLASNQKQSPIMRIGALVVAGIVRMRQGHEDALPLLSEGKNIAFKTTELQRTVPVLSALMEYEWITGQTLLEAHDFDMVFSKIDMYQNLMEKSELLFWFTKTGREHLAAGDIHPAFNPHGTTSAITAAKFWRGKRLSLFGGHDVVRCRRGR